MKCEACGIMNDPENTVCSGCGKALSEAPVESAASTAAPQENSVQQFPENSNHQDAGQETESGATPDQPAQEAIPPEQTVPDAEWNEEQTAYVESGESAAAQAGDSPVQEAAVADSAQEPPKKKKKMGLIAGIVAAVAAVAVIGIIAVSSIQSKPYVALTQVYHNFQTNDGDTIFYSSTDKKPVLLEGLMTEAHYSLNDDRAALLMSTGELWLVMNGDKELIDETVSPQICMSANGDSIAYTTDGVSKWYNVNSKKAEELDEIATSKVFSPDGKILSYTDEDNVAYLKESGKKESVFLEDCMVIALANNNKFIYYLEENQKTQKTNLYVQKGLKGEPQKLASGFYMEGYSRILVNQDLSEMLFGSNDKVYITKNGAEKQQLAKSKTDDYWENTFLPFPLHGQHCESASISRFVVNVHLYNTKSFTNTAIFNVSSSSIFSINGKLEGENIVSNNVRSSSRVGKNIYYIDDKDRLYKIPVSGGEKEQLRKKVYSLYITGDRNSIYYVTTDKELCFLNKKGEEVMISDELDAMNSYSDAVLTTLSTGDIYYLSDGTLYYSAKGSEGKKIADDVTWFDTDYDCVVYYVEDDEKVYRGNPSKGFDEFTEMAAGEWS